MRFPRAYPACTVLLLLLAGAGSAAKGGAAQYAVNGDLLVPADYRNWIFLTSGVDMSYTGKAPMDGQSMFDNVFVDPASWQAFRQTGHWPDHAVFVLEARGGASHGSINKHGQYQTESLMGIEVHVRDDARFKGGWGFFAFDGRAPAKLIPASASCYACHQAHGAVDTTFTQFYPTAKPIAVNSGNYHEQ